MRTLPFVLVTLVLLAGCLQLEPDKDAAVASIGGATAETSTSSASTGGPDGRGQRSVGIAADDVGAGTVAQSVYLAANYYLGSHVAVPWHQVAPQLPDGFEPRGFPDEMLMNQHWGAPAGTLADVTVSVVAYANGTIDGTEIGAGRLAAAYAKAQPPAGHEVGDRPVMVWLAVTASDPLVAAALATWGVDAGSGDVSIDPGLGPALAVSTASAAGPLDGTLEAASETAQWLGGSTGTSHVSFVSESSDGLVEAAWTLGAHRAYPGAARWIGTMGDAGQIVAPGYGGILWFGGGTAPSEATGTWHYALSSIWPDA